MIRFLSALPPELEEELADGLLSSGHDLLGRCEPSVSAREAVRLGADIVLIEAGMLSRGVIRESDAHGIRLIALARSSAERRYAIGLDFYEVVEASEGWPGVQEGLRIPEPQTPPSGVRAESPGTVEIPDEPVAAREADPVRSLRGAERGSRPRRGSERGGPGSGGSERGGAAPPGLRGGSVIAVWGPAGAPGRSTIALNIAAELASAGRRVALVDADSHAASLATQLGLLDESPGFAIACRLAGMGDLDHRELDRLAQHAGRPALRVLAGLSRVGRWPELAPAKVAAVLQQCRSWADYTVVDVAASLESDEEISSDLQAPRRNGATLAALRAADLVVAVGSAEPVGVARFLRAHLDLAEQIEPERLLVVMNRVRSSAVGIGPVAQLSRTLARFGGIEDAHYVPDDRGALDAAVLAGQSLREAAPKSPTRLAIGRLVQERILAASEPAKRRGSRPGRAGRTKRAERAAALGRAALG